MDFHKQAKLDWILILAVVGQIVLGVFLVHSVSSAPGERLFDDPLFFFRRHLWVLAGSLVVMFVVCRYWSATLVSAFIARHANVLLGAAILLILLTLIPGVGIKINGSSRWLGIGSQVLYPQPVATFLVALYIGNLLANNLNNNRLRTKSSLLLCSVVAVFVFINSLQLDLTSSALLVMLVFFMCCVAGWYKFAALSLFGAAALSLLTIATTPYRWARVVAWFDPFDNRFDSGYQIALSLSAVGGGDVWGVGYGEGVLKTQLPAVQDSFIYAALVEELGAAGGLLVLALSAIIGWRCFVVGCRLMANQKHREGLLAYFVSFWISLLSLCHAASVLGLLPFFNVPFPLLSYGGSYLFVFVLAVAIVLKFDWAIRMDDQATAGRNRLYRRPVFWVFLSVFFMVGGSVTSKAAFNRGLDREYASYRTFFQPDYENEIPVPAAEKRGRILDRFGKVLAKNVPVFNVWVDPEKLDFNSNKLAELSGLLNLDLEKTVIRIKNYKESGKRFAYLRRGIDPDTADAVHKLGVTGVNSNPAEKRLYPFGESMVHIVGIADIDGNGQEGVEKSFDKHLLGDGKDNNVQLSIDHRIQGTVFSLLKKNAEKHKVKRGAAMVIDARNGEILAMASHPSTDPNNRAAILSSHMINRATSTRVEPGAVISPFILMGAMNDPDFRDTVSTIDTSPGHFKIGVHTIKDPVKYGEIRLEDIVRKSSKVGLSKISLSVPRKTIWQMLDDLGFGVCSGVELPSEVPGFLPHWEFWTDLKTATISYGYGLAVTPMQIAEAYMSIANDGRVPSLTILMGSGKEGGRGVLTTPAIAKKIRYQLERKPVLTDRAGNKIRIAGKSALVQKVGTSGYVDRYIGLFAGMAPIEDPNFLVVVMLDEPQANQTMAGEFAEEIFQAIVRSMERLAWKQQLPFN